MTAFAGPTFFWAATALSDGAGCDSSGESSRSRFRTFRTFGFLKETTGAVAPEVIASESSGPTQPAVAHLAFQQPLTWGAPSIPFEKRGTPRFCGKVRLCEPVTSHSRPPPGGQPPGMIGAPGAGPQAAQQNSAAT